MSEVVERQLVREPMQLRSRNTMERIVSTAEELVAMGVFDRTTVLELVRRAQTSVGAFYSRFKDQAALQSVLEERFVQRVEADLAALTDLGRWSGEPLAAVVHGVLEGLVDLFQRERGAIRILARGSTGAGRSNLGPARRIDRTICGGVEELLLAYDDEIAHPRPVLAIRVGLMMVVATLRERLVYGANDLLPERIEHDDLVAELATAYLAYLQGGVISGR